MAASWAEADAELRARGAMPGSERYERVRAAWMGKGAPGAAPSSAGGAQLPAVPAGGQSAPGTPAGNASNQPTPAEHGFIGALAQGAKGSEVGQFLANRGFFSPADP